jgi:hypothetical protein
MGGTGKANALDDWECYQFITDGNKFWLSYKGMSDFYFDINDKKVEFSGDGGHVTVNTVTN